MSDTIESDQQIEEPVKALSNEESDLEDGRPLSDQGYEGEMPDLADIDLVS